MKGEVMSTGFEEGEERRETVQNTHEKNREKKNESAGDGRWRTKKKKKRAPFIASDQTDTQRMQTE